MAIDSAQKRASAATVVSYWNAPSVIPSGTFDEYDRAHIAWSYSGIVPEQADTTPQAAPHWKLKGQDYSEWEEPKSAKQKREIDKLVRNLFEPKKEKSKKKSVATESVSEVVPTGPTLAELQAVYQEPVATENIRALQKDLVQLLKEENKERAEREVRKRLAEEARRRRRDLANRLREREAKRKADLLEQQEIEELVQLLLTAGII